MPDSPGFQFFSADPNGMASGQGNQPLAKNVALTPAGSDLGMGDALTQQVQDLILQRRKPLLQASQQPPSAFGALGLGLGGATGAGNQGSAGWALLGQGGMGG